MSQLSPRLRRAIESYYTEMDPDGLKDLATVVRNGSAPWFLEDFRAAIVEGAFTPRLWEELTDVAMDDDDDELLGDYLRDVWTAVAPGAPYPVSEPR